MLTQNLVTSPPTYTQAKPNEKLFANNLIVHHTHASFLKSRHKFSHLMSEIIQLQLACVENLLNG
jgi:hypothetical protein